MFTDPVAPAGKDVTGLRFGPFELDLRSGELRKSGLLVKVQHQPLKVLTILASRPGELVTREEIQREVWPDGTFVDFEQSLNFCVRQIRSVLNDSALEPHYIETLPKRGYRWIAPLERLVAPSAPATILPIRREWEAPSRGPEKPALGMARLRQATVALMVLVAVLGGLLVVALRRTSGPAYSLHRITYRRGFVQSARFAPDGEVVLSAQWESLPVALFLASPSYPESRQLDVGGQRVVGVSGRDVAFLKERGALARAPLAGGPAKDLLSSVREADWADDGSKVAVVRSTQDGTARVEYPAGTPIYKAPFCDSLRISPGGERVAFIEHPTPGDDRGSVVVVDIGKGTKRVLSSDWGSASGLAWSPNGQEVWFTAARVGADSALHAVNLRGEERLILASMGRLVIHDIAPDGRVLLSRDTLRGETRYHRLSEPQERDLSWLDLSLVADLSSDGSSLLFGESGEGGGSEYSVYLRRTDGERPVRLGGGRPLALSPDGKWALAIPVRDQSRLDLLPTGAGETRPLRDPEIAQYLYASFVPDGQHVLSGALAKDGKRRSYLQDISGGPARRVAPDGVLPHEKSVSPDGSRFVASCPAGWCLYPLSGGTVEPVRGLDDFDSLLGWSADGKSLFVATMIKQLPVRVDRLMLATGRREKWRELEPADVAGAFALLGAAVTPDGSAYAYSVLRHLSDLYIADGLR